jgi:hypothetical protein
MLHVLNEPLPDGVRIASSIICFSDYIKFKSSSVLSQAILLAAIFIDLLIFFRMGSISNIPRELLKS